MRAIADDRAADDLDRTIAGWIETLAGKVPSALAATKARLLTPERRAAYAAALEAERGPSPTDTTYGPCIVGALQQVGLPLRQGPGFSPKPLTKQN